MLDSIKITLKFHICIKHSRVCHYVRNVVMGVILYSVTKICKALVVNQV